MTTTKAPSSNGVALNVGTICTRWMTATAASARIPVAVSTTSLANDDSSACRSTRFDNSSLDRAVRIRFPFLRSDPSWSPQLDALQRARDVGELVGLVFR